MSVRADPAGQSTGRSPQPQLCTEHASGHPELPGQLQGQRRRRRRLCGDPLRGRDGLRSGQVWTAAEERRIVCSSVRWESWVGGPVSVPEPALHPGEVLPPPGLSGSGAAAAVPMGRARTEPEPDHHRPVVAGEVPVSQLKQHRLSHCDNPEQQQEHPPTSGG